MVDLGFFKGGFQKCLLESLGPLPLLVNSLSVFDKFVDSKTLFALHCEAVCTGFHAVFTALGGQLHTW